MKAVKRIIAIAAVLLAAALLLNIGQVRDRALETGASFARSLGITRNDKLSADEVFDSMNAQLAAYGTTLEFRNTDTDTVIGAFDRIISEHPEFFWLDGGYTCRQSSDDEAETLITLTVTTYFNASLIPERDAELRQVVADIVSQVDKNSTDYEKALFAHDYIVNCCTYDFALSDSISAGMTDCDKTGATAYGCLVGRCAICSGYTSAFQLLMSELGVDCGCVKGWSGSDAETGGHVWNYITLDGENYYVDVTWDDMSYDGTVSADSEYLSHRYFCVTGSELYKSHHLDEGQSDPNCSSTAYNYHIYSGLYLSSYDYGTLCEMIESQFGCIVMEVKFSSIEELELACNDLFVNNGVFSIPSIRSGGYRTVWHSVCEDSCVLTLWLQ